MDRQQGAGIGTIPSWRLGYRPALDGIRGVAILLVVLGHAQDVPGMIRGGAVGVTLFFVLSGFLIASLLVEESRDSGHVDLRRFYMRRALRLLPALIALLAAVALGMFIVGRAGEVARCSRDGAVAADALLSRSAFGPKVCV